VPVTPFHFGVGLFAKGVFPRQVSFVAFVVSQVVIDCETAYFMLVKQEWPFHRWAHTLVVGALVGIGAGLATSVAATFWSRRHSETWRIPDLREAALLPALLGGLVGGLSHSLLDAVMHDDVRLLRPFSDANPLLAVASLPVLHLSLVLAGLAGVALLGFAPERIGLRRLGS
jgi:Voltage gated chloride channel